jgi:hypothetical protein
MKNIFKTFVLFALAGFFATASAQQLTGIRSHRGATVDLSVVTFNATTPGAITAEPLPITGTGIAAAQFSEGYYYVVVATGNNASGPWQLWKVSAEDWTAERIGTTNLLPAGMNIPIGMGKNYATNELFLVTQDLIVNPPNVTMRNSFYTLNTTTGAITLVRTIANEMLQVVALSPSGDWYGITAHDAPGGGGQFKSIDITNGTTTLIGNTGVTPNFTQSMTFDRTTGKLFWVSANGSDRSYSTTKLYEINVATGALTDLGTLQDRSYIMGLSSALIATSFSPARGSIDQEVTANPTVIFNNNIVATDLSTISISPAVTGVSASIQRSALTITHDGFAWNTQYTVTVPKEAIQFLEYDITWTFRTMWDPADCNPPSQVNATNIAGIRATLSWRENGEATAWNLKYGAPGFDPQTAGTLVSGITANPYVLQGLTEYTTYDVYIQAVCGDGSGGNSGWSEKYTFATGKNCDAALTVPWTEGFESTTFPEACWGNFDIDGIINAFLEKPTMWERYGNLPGIVSPRSGSGMAGHNLGGINFEPDHEEGWLVTPKIAIPPAGDDVYILRFWSYHVDPEAYHPRNHPWTDPFDFTKVSVWVSTESNDPKDSTFVEVWTPTLIAGSWVDVAAQWREYKVNLSEFYAGQEIYLAFVYEGRWGTRWFIDDLSINTYSYKDIQLSEIFRPQTGGPNMTNAEEITVKLYNNGSLPLTNVPITLKINGVEHNEIIPGPIHSLTYFTYTFNHKPDFSVTGDAPRTFVIEVEVFLEGDQAPANNRRARTIVATSSNRVVLQGISRWEFMEPESRFIQFYSDSVYETIVTELAEFWNDERTSTAGEFLNDRFYMYWQNGTGNTGQFMELDAKTWTEIRRVDVSLVAHEMTFDYSTRTMYAVRRGTTTSTLYTVNMNNGVLTQVATISGLVLGMACDFDGTMYAALQNGNIGRINKTTGAFTQLASTGLTNGRGNQSMAFDHNTGRLFWALHNDVNPGMSNIYGGLLEIDKTTGAPYYYGQIGQIHTILVGLHTVFKDPNAVYYTLNITTPDNGTIKVMDGTIEIGDGDEVNENSTLNLTATPSSGYRFVQWWDGNTNRTRTLALTQDTTISATFEIIPNSILDIEGSKLTVFPNPVSDVLNIQTDEIIKQIFVLDVNGKVMMQLHGDRKTIDLQSISAGSYILRIHTETGIIPVRIIKQ